MAKFIVTGGAGFIGSNIVKELVKQGHKVKVIDNLSTGHRRNLKEVADKIEFVKADINNLKALQKEFRGFDYCLHQAAMCSVPRSVADPIGANDSNITGTLNVLMAARDNKLKRVVYASSSSVYGEAPEEFKVEGLPVSPLSPYALSKLSGEFYCRMFYPIYGLETVSLRYFNVFGPNQDPNSEYAAVIPKLIIMMLAGKRPTIYGDGEQSRDFTFVANNVQANILAATSKAGSGEVFNIACGESFTINQLVDLINKYLGTNLKPIYKKMRVGDIKHSKADISKAKKVLKYKPSVEFIQGLEETIKWYQQMAKN